MCIMNLSSLSLSLSLSLFLSFFLAPTHNLSSKRPNYCSRSFMDILHLRKSYFLAELEYGDRSGRRYSGLNTHMMYLEPSALVGQLLLDKARTGDFVPFTNTEQDVLETVFSPYASGRISPPPHKHHRAMSNKGNCPFGYIPLDASGAAPNVTYNPLISVSASTNQAHDAGEAEPGPILERRYAVATFVCEGQGPRALRWLRGLEEATKINSVSSVDSVAFTSAAPDEWKEGGWDRVIQVPTGAVVVAPRTDGDDAARHKHMWVEKNSVQAPGAAGCSALKLLAWSYTEYDGILLSDPNVCFTAPFDLQRWFESQVAARSYFAAPPERALRQYDGLDTRLLFLQPSATVGRILLDKARNGDFVPYMNSEQDGRETGFSPHAAAESVGRVPLPRHVLSCDAGSPQHLESVPAPQPAPQPVPQPVLPAPVIHTADGISSEETPAPVLPAAALRDSSDGSETIPMNRLRGKRPLVAMVLRGQAFRIGYQLQFKSHPKPQTQMRALESIVRKVIEPLEDHGWDVELFLHAAIADDRHPSLYDYYSGLLRGPWSRGNRTRAPKHVWIEREQSKLQVHGVSKTLKWMNDTAPETMAEASHILLTRVDLHFKSSDVNLPASGYHPHNVVSIFHMMPPDLPRSPRVGDTAFWVPKAMLERFKRALTSNAILSSMHEIDKVLPVQVLYHSLHQTDSHRGWNPIYRMSGRDGISKVNRDPPTLWTPRHERIFMRIWSTTGGTGKGASIPKHRFHFLPNGVDDSPALQITIELKGLNAPPMLFPPFDKTHPMAGIDPSAAKTGLLVLDRELYFVHTASLSDSTGESDLACYIKFPVPANKARVEVVWSELGNTTRTAGGCVARKYLCNLQSSTTSLLMIRVPAKPPALEDAPAADVEPLHEKWKWGVEPPRVERHRGWPGLLTYGSGTSTSHHQPRPQQQQQTTGDTIATNTTGEEVSSGG